MLSNFLALADVSINDFQKLIQLASELKEAWRRDQTAALLKGKVLAMVFQKPSLRTRVSFDVAMLQLGGHALYLSPQEIGLGQRESTSDVSRVLSRYADAIMARVFEHGIVEELANHSRVPLINGLSDREHPCQALADVFTIYEKRGRLKGLKLGFLGDGNNVARSLMFACALSGMEFAIASPASYELDSESVSVGGKLAEKTGGKITLTHDPTAVSRGADVVYTDVWASMGQEEEAKKRAEVFPPYQLNDAIVQNAKTDVLVMHCLPAHRGQEITEQVIEGRHSVVFDQAENRLHAQKAILVHLLNPESTTQFTASSQKV